MLQDTNAERLVDLAGSTNTDKWIGVKISLTPGDGSIILDAPNEGDKQ